MFLKIWKGIFDLYGVITKLTYGWCYFIWTAISYFIPLPFERPFTFETFTVFIVSNAFHGYIACVLFNSYFFFIFFIDFGANINYQVLPLGLSFNQLPNGSLSIASVTKATEGMYTCTAQNGVRTGIAKTINVTVNGKWRRLWT